MIAAQIQQDIVSAMKAGQALKLSVLRMVSSELNYKKIEVQRELTDEDVVLVLRKEAKKRTEAIVAYESAGRSESATQESQELGILQSYLPVQMSEEQLKDQISKLKELEGITDFGQAMRIVSPLFKGKADGGLVAKIVKEKIAA
jgi:uncharacterized protein